MVRINDAWFISATIRDGKVWEMAADMVFEFEVVGGKAVSFELRSDRREARGERREAGGGRREASE